VTALDWAAYFVEEHGREPLSDITDSRNVTDCP
jgi:hypothetical protein